MMMKMTIRAQRATMIAIHHGSRARSLVADASPMPLVMSGWTSQLTPE